MGSARERRTKIRLKPLDDRVVIERSEAEEKTAGGILLPDSAKEKPLRGVVIAVGPGRLLSNGQRGAFSISVGDEVLFSAYGGVGINVDGEELTILRESDILAALPGDPMTTGPAPRPKPKPDDGPSKPTSGNDPTPPAIT